MPENISLTSDKLKPNELLMLLLSQKGTYLSGEQISNKFGVTRSAIWKQINAIRNMGYVIKSSPRLGYCLEKSPDFLFPEEIWSRCSLSALGSKIYYYTVTGSTNEDAKKLAQDGVPHGTLVIAEKQQKARGRLGRAWDSPNGGLWFTLILRPCLAPMDAPKLTILTAVAVAEAIIHTTGIDAKIKWPNDILIDGKKVCGILTEMSTEMDAINHVIIGVGINVNNSDFPEELKDKGTSLRQVKGEKVSRIQVLSSLLERFEHYYVKAETEGFKEVLESWRSLCTTLGQKVKITGQKENFEGIALDIDESGALLIKTGDGKVVRILSGDVSLR